MHTINIDCKERREYMEDLRSKLIYLIELKGISSEEVIKVSRDLDKLIVKHYQNNQ